jgi:hypothetical protein
MLIHGRESSVGPCEQLSSEPERTVESAQDMIGSTVESFSDWQTPRPEHVVSGQNVFSIYKDLRERVQPFKDELISVGFRCEVVDFDGGAVFPGAMANPL